MSSFPNIAPAFLEEVLRFLAPLFIAGANGEPAAARQAALSALAAYDPRTEQELRLAAQITSLGFSALEALAQSMNPDLSVNAVLRLRGNANALHRSAHQCERVLDRLCKERLAAVARQPDIPAQAAVQDDIEPSAAEPASPAASVTGLSRQQRRELERRRARTQRQDAQHTRLVARHTPVDPLSRPYPAVAA
jgi:hypothetical protein